MERGRAVFLPNPKERQSSSFFFKAISNAFSKAFESILNLDQNHSAQ
jgi:hypothetical protein